MLLIMAWTGLRWAEARALTVADLMEVPTPGLLVRVSAPEGVGTKSTKGGRSRRVPLANRVLPLVRAMAADKIPTELLLTTASGARLHRGAVVRTMAWSQTGEGRRLHFLGTGADRAGLERLNSGPGYAGGYANRCRDRITVG